MLDLSESLGLALLFSGIMETKITVCPPAYAEGYLTAQENLKNVGKTRFRNYAYVNNHMAAFHEYESKIITKMDTDK